ncbi:BnaC03g75940D [Brassica napus]|uniref:Uncharacterized protein n=3 Tax=Brassica TaxID=3705 RepID=A0A0D3BHY8_BRAOL|nr:unnamed protein product [Brassica napus]CDY51782.1 BnaC03g75940D [Brassica napus]VDC97394.1 unnamed protein product [Brassica oleracea]
MSSGAGDAVSRRRRRRWASSPALLVTFTLCFLFHVFLRLLPVRFLWIVGGVRSRRMLRRRQELRLFVGLLLAVFPTGLVLPPAMNREDSLAASALLWTSGSDPVVPLSGYRRSSQTVNLVQIFQPRMELRLQLSNSISPSLERLESHGPPCLASPHLTGTRSQSTTSSYPNLFGDASISPAYKVMLSSTPWFILDGGMIPLRRRISGDHLVGADVRYVSPRVVLTMLYKLMSTLTWAWPSCGMEPVSPRSFLPRPKYLEKNEIQQSVASGFWARFSEIPVGFTGISPRCILSYLFSWKKLPLDSADTVLFWSSSSSEEKSLSPHPLPMARGTSSDLWPSVCFSSCIVLSSCGAVSTGP